jgi:hypothetical protein
MHWTQKTEHYLASDQRLNLCQGDQRLKNFQQLSVEKIQHISTANNEVSQNKQRFLTQKQL